MCRDPYHLNILKELLFTLPCPWVIRNEGRLNQPNKYNADGFFGHLNCVLGEFQLGKLERCTIRSIGQKIEPELKAVLLSLFYLSLSL